MHHREKYDQIGPESRASKFAAGKPGLQPHRVESNRDDLGKGEGELEKFGAICQVEDKTERLAKIAELHLAALKERKSSLIVTPTHGECRTICGAVREGMKGEGMLSGPDQTVPRLNRLNLTEAQRGGACSKRLEVKWISL